MIRNKKTGLTFSSAPEFGTDGQWPPVETDWIPVRWEIFEGGAHNIWRFAMYELIKIYNENFSERADISSPLLTEDALRDDFLYDSIFSHSSLFRRTTRKSYDIECVINIDSRNISRTFSFPKDPSKSLSVALGQGLVAYLNLNGSISWNDARSFTELRRIIHYIRWRREDPVTQLPPGLTTEITHSVTTGLSVEHSQSLASSLGLSIETPATGVQAKLSHQLNQDFGLKIDLTKQEEKSIKLILTNPSNEHYRRFALWHLEHRFVIHALNVEGESDDYPEVHPSWILKGETELVSESTPFISYADVPNT